MPPLTINYFGGSEPVVQLEASLDKQYFAVCGKRVAFDHHTWKMIAADERLVCSLRLSAKIAYSSELPHRLQLSDVDVINQEYRLTVHNGLLSLRIELAKLRAVGKWNLERQDLDLTQAMQVDDRISISQRWAGVQPIKYRSEIRLPSIPTYLEAVVRIKGALRMQVPDRSEPAEDKSIVSFGRPESNRRRF